MRSAVYPSVKEVACEKGENEEICLVFVLVF